MIPVTFSDAREWEALLGLWSSLWLEIALYLALGRYRGVSGFDGAGWSGTRWDVKTCNIGDQLSSRAMLCDYQGINKLLLRRSH